jgi:GTPase
VTGNEIEKWVAMTNFDNPDALVRFQKILSRMGLIKELKKMGICEGDVIFLDKKELVFESDHLEAFDD